MVDTGLNGHLNNHRFKDIVEAVGKRPFAIRQAHGPEWPVVKANSHNRQSKGCVTLIPRYCGVREAVQGSRCKV